MADQSIQGINAIAIARGTSEPSNTDVLWLDENLEGGLYSRLKAYVSGGWELISRIPKEILTDLKKVDGAGSGLDADTLRGLAPSDLISNLSTGQLLVGQSDAKGLAKTIGGIATVNQNGIFAYVTNSISHTGLTDIGTNTHAQIDTHISDATIHFTQASIDHTAIQNIGTNTHSQIDTHIADATIHFTQASIDHTAIQNIGTNTHAQIDTHIADATIHFTQASIDHTAIQNIGTNTHAQIDTHIADATIHFTQSSIDHTSIQNIGTNTHAQIDTHISSTANPHSVTASQVGNTVSQWNASSIEGNITNIGTLGASADGKAVVWDNATSRFIMSLVGLADGDYGDVTVGGSGTSITIDNNVVTNAKLTDVATSTIKGRATVGSGDPEDLTATQVRTIINVEDGADVTDTTNVTNAGALMDSEVTNLAQVKAFDSSDYATSAQGATADNALPKSGGAMTGAITTNSTFDGRDVATDGTKLDGIEAGAEVNPTDGEIETSYNSQVPEVTQSEAEAGTVTTVKRWTPQRVKQAIDALAGGGGTDPNAVHVNAQSEISGITAKPTPTTNDILLIEDAADNNNKKKITIGDLPSGGGGVFGITNASGIYTYYTTIELALSAASSGTVIEQFSNVSVSTSTTINLIDGVTWNMNGYEYKNTSAGSFTMFEIPTNTTVKFAINNGYIRRNTGSSNGGILLDTKNTLASEIIINGVTFENIEGTSAKGEATLIGGIFRSSSTTQIGFEYSGTVNNIKVFSYNGNKVQSSLSVVEVFNSTFYSENSANNINNVNAYNSNFTSDGDSGLSFGNGTSNCYNCVGSSTASHGIYVFNGELHNCSGFSTAGYGIQLGSSSSVVYSSIGKSTADNGFNLATSSRAFNCYAESSANAGVRFKGAGVFTNGVAKSTGTSSFSQAVFCNVSGAEVTNCDLIVTTATNNCISGNVLITAKLANNTYKGSTVAVNSNITNSITNTQDSQGNILI